MKKNKKTWVAITMSDKPIAKVGLVKKRLKSETTFC